MTAEDNFKTLCNLTTRVLGLPDDSLALRSRKRTLQTARAVAGYIGRTEEDIHRSIIGKVLNRNRSLIYHYERTHEANYDMRPLYRNTYNLIFKAYKDVGGTKSLFLDNNLMKHHLLKNGVKEVLNPEVLIEVKSGRAVCVIKTSYFDLSNQLGNVKLALKNYHFTIKII